MEEGKYPWIVQMQTGSDGPSGHTWYCTGALLDPTHVLTAAHCIVSSKFGKTPGEHSDGKIFVLQGTSNVKKNGYVHEAHILSNVSDYVLHPTWETQDMLGSDVAVLTLTSPVQYSDKVKPICLPSNPGQNYVGKVAVASGFGVDKHHQLQDNLMETNVTVISEKDCFNNVKDEMTGGASKWNMSIPEEDVRKILKTKICVKGSPINNNPDWTTGTREGDSGSSLNFEEHQRFQM